MNREIENIIDEIKKVIKGKDDVARQTLMAILANGHILFDDVPGVGKTTLAITLGKVLGMKYNRIQFTPDVLPSDIVGFSVYNKVTGQFDYMAGVVNNTNILLGDEINRTSSKTQSALLEAMEEYQVTVDGNTYQLQNPFIVIATQNNVGTAGTQLLPYAQLDRFLVKLSIGYPDFQSQMDIIKDRQGRNPIDSVSQIVTCDDILRMQSEVCEVSANDDIVSYITSLTFATRDNDLIEAGVSPRGAIALNNMAKANAYVQGRNYVIPDDVRDVFKIVCAHRIVLSQKARFEKITADDVIDDVIKKVKVPNSVA
jgi:MoxR-like ATPase